MFNTLDKQVNGDAVQTHDTILHGKLVLRLFIAMIFSSILAVLVISFTCSKALMDS